MGSVGMTVWQPSLSGVLLFVFGNTRLHSTLREAYRSDGDEVN